MAEGPTLTGPPVTGPSGGPVIRKDIIEQCRELLAEGNVTEFNRLRPKGKIDLTGIDLSRKDLRGINFDDVILIRANLTGANFSEATFCRAILDRADFTKAILTKAIFGQGTQAQFACFRGVSAEGADFHGTNLTHAELVDGNFCGADFHHAAMSDTALAGADFTEANLFSAFLLGSSVEGTCFHKANLASAVLVQIKGKDVDFSGANLVRASILRAVLHGEKLSFEGAWTRGLDHDPDIATDEALKKSISDREPPEGEFSKKELKIDPALLVDGIPGSNRAVYDAATKELEALVGLKSVKAFVKRLADVMLTQHDRDQLELPSLENNLHLVFTGNPGTGKTTVARIISKILKGIGYLEKGHLVETDRSGLVAGFTGQTALKTDEIVKQAMGGVLIVDEAYALAPKGGSPQDFGPEAIATLLKRMEDNRGKFVVIACGYTDEMRDFIAANSGLRSRFTLFVNFPDYTAPEIVDILDRMSDRMKFVSSPQEVGLASLLLSVIKAKERGEFANGRSVRNLFQKITDAYSSRIRQAVRERYFVTDALKVLEGESSSDLAGLIATEQTRQDQAGNHGLLELDLVRLSALAQDSEVLKKGSSAHGEFSRILIGAKERLGNRGDNRDRGFMSKLEASDLPYGVYFKEGAQVLEGKTPKWVLTSKSGEKKEVGLEEFPVAAPFPEPTEETLKLIEELAEKMTLPDEV